MPLSARTPEGRARPFLVGREVELALYHPRRPATFLMKRILSAAPELYPCVPASRGGLIDAGRSVFTDNEMIYLDPWNGGERDWYSLELALAESDDPFTLHERRILGEARADRLSGHVERVEGLDVGSTLLVGLGDDLFTGRSRGFHWNYCSEREMSEIDLDAFVTWSAASAVLFGAGGLGGARGVVLDGRIGHMHAAVGPSVSTLERRGMTSTRRPSLSGRLHRLHFQHEGHARLGAILSDGLKMILLRALERDALGGRPVLSDPIEQMRALNLAADPLSFRLRCAGGNTMTSVELVAAYRRLLGRFCERAAGELPGWASGRILPALDELIAAATGGDIETLGARLDSWMRIRLYGGCLARRFGMGLSDVAPWMPVAALLGRRRSTALRMTGSIAGLETELDGATKEELRRVCSDNRLDRRDESAGKRLQAIRLLASLELRLASARADNPLDRLVRIGFLVPSFGQELLGDPRKPPPDPANRSRVRARLIRKMAGGNGTGRAGWRCVIRYVRGREVVFDLADPFAAKVVRPRPPRAEPDSLEEMTALLLNRRVGRGLRHGRPETTYSMRRLSWCARVIARTLLDERRQPGGPAAGGADVRQPPVWRVPALRVRARSLLRGLPPRPDLALEANDDFEPIFWIHHMPRSSRSAYDIATDGDHPARPGFAVTHMYRRPVGLDGHTYQIAGQLVTCPLARPEECAERRAWMRRRQVPGGRFDPWFRTRCPHLRIEEWREARRADWSQRLLLATVLLCSSFALAVVPRSSRPGPLVRTVAGRLGRTLVLLPRAVFPSAELKWIGRIRYETVGSDDYPRESIAG